MALTKVTGKGITCSAVTEDKLGTSAVTTNKIGPNAVTSAKINNGSVTADDLASTLDLSSKTVTLASDLVTDLKRPVQDNIALLGFKMAVNDGLTVFNLVDGVVDEFNDESGTDEAEGSNDLYCASNDHYVNSTQPQGVSACVSAGFSMTAITEPDTSTAGTNPTHGTITYGTFTVPSGVTSLTANVWGAGGGGGASTNAGGGGGGYTTGTIAVTSGQTLYAAVGEGGNIGSGSGSATAKGAGNGGSFNPSPNSPGNGGSGGGAAGSGVSAVAYACRTQPNFYVIAGGGGSGGGFHVAPQPIGWGGPGGGLTGNAGSFNGCTTNAYEQTSGSGLGPGGQSAPGGGGDQEQGGQGGSAPQGTGQSGSALQGGAASPGQPYIGAGGGGYYGGGGAGYGPVPVNGGGGGGGGSSYYSHPQVTCGSTEDGGDSGAGCTPSCNYNTSGGNTSPLYAPLIAFGHPQYPSSPNCVYSSMGRGSPAKTGPALGSYGGDGYVLLTASLPATVTSTTLISNSFTSTSVATSARIVVFQEDVESPTLNTDIIASVSRDGTNFTNATLTDSGYVTGSSGQRILTGQADISGQPSGQSMRWKLALANNTVKIHGVALQWS